MTWKACFKRIGKCWYDPWCWCILKQGQGHFWEWWLQVFGNFWLIINEISLRTMLQCPSWHLMTEDCNCQCVLMIDNSHWASGGEQRTCLVLTFSVMADCSEPAPAHHHLMSPPGLAPAAAAGDDVAQCETRLCLYSAHCPATASPALLSYTGCSCRLACDWWSLRSLCALIGGDWVLQPAWL